MSSKIQLTDYFRAVERHLESSGKMPSFYFRVRICDELIELRFPTKELEQVGRSSLSGFITEDVMIIFPQARENVLPYGKAMTKQAAL